MNSNLGLGTLKSTAGYIGIRAQLKKTYKYAATQNSKASCRRSRRRDLGSLGFIFFSSFLFFSFSFSYFFYFRRFRADYFLVFLLSLYFLDLDVIV